MRRATAVVLIAVLVLLAGCGGTAGGETTTPATEGSETPTATSTATPTETPTRTPISASGFPAVDGTEVNETLLATVHRRALSNVSYTLVLEEHVNDTDVRVEARREGNVSLLRTTVGNTSETDYTNGSTEYIRSERKNGTFTYRNRTVGNATPYTAKLVVDDYIDSAEHAPVAITTYEGTRVVDLTATRADIKPDALVANTTVDAFESRILVDRRGRIRLFTYRISGTTNGDPFGFRLRFRLSNVGSTTVERPDWVDRA